MIYALDDDTPRIDPTAWLAPGCHVMGKVGIGADASVWFGATLRGDNEPIVVGQGSNIQENAVLHTDMGHPLSIGAGCTIGHKAMLHGCTVGDGSLIGMGATVLNGARDRARLPHRRGRTGDGGQGDPRRIAGHGRARAGDPPARRRGPCGSAPLGGYLCGKRPPVPRGPQGTRLMDRPTSLVRRTGWPTSTSRPVVTPLQPSVVYASPDPDALDAQYADGTGYTYAREGHPNAEVLAAKIDMLEGAPALFGPAGIVTGSGMSALGAVFLGLLRAGDHVLGGDQLYGRTLRLMNDDLPRLGIATSLADATDAAAMAAAIRPETRMVVVEVISNPTIRVADVTGIAALCRARGVLLVVDNTFTTPRLMQPFALGADIVVHSVTKLLAGHSDATLGYVAARDADLRRRINDANVTWGLTPSPFDCWLAERGLHSFDLRLERAEATARRLADALAGEGGVARVIYPTRPDHPDHNRAMGLLNGRGGNMLSFELKGGRAAANAFTRAAPEVAFAPTLGDVGTTLSHPASSSHRGLTPAARAALGIGEGFFRVSVGIEEADMLIDEFCRAARAAV